MKILIADDDAVSRCMMERMLRQAGYEVVMAHDGREALQRLLSHDGPRLALLDWMMPGLDGPGVCLEVRSSRERAYTYITLLTSKDAKEDLVAGLEAGADDYLTKPCDAQELKARLRTGQRILRLEDTLIEAREEMRFKATHDSLTALWNRGAILARIQAEIDRAQRERTRLSLLLCDADHFKQINDAYGHPAGDAVLKEMAVRLRNAVRSVDAVGRYGGEEFLILLTDCGEDSLRLRAEQVWQAIGSSAFIINSERRFLSVSLGGLSIDGRSGGQSLEALLSQVDVALYRAKLGGRNRIVIAGSQPCAKPDPVEKSRSLPENYGMVLG